MESKQEIETLKQEIRDFHPGEDPQADAKQLADWLLRTLDTMEKARPEIVKQSSEQARKDFDSAYRRASASFGGMI